MEAETAAITLEIKTVFLTETKIPVTLMEMEMELSTGEISMVLIMETRIKVINIEYIFKINDIQIIQIFWSPSGEIWLP